MIYMTVQVVTPDGIRYDHHANFISVKTPDGETRFGLVQMYTQKNKSNIISYVLGTCNGTSNELKIYKFSADSNILGANQLDNLIEQDETISAELNSLNVTGVKISKEMKIIPINNTLLYIEKGRKI